MQLKYFLVALLCGVLIGLGSATYALTNGFLPGGIRLANGWTTYPATGSQDANLYGKAIIALMGLLALNPSEARYFDKRSDEHGQPLRENCVYTVSGKAMPGRWWSVTVYAADGFLPVNGQPVKSFFGEPTGRRQAWQVQLSRHPPTRGAWISTQNAGRFSLTLRIYGPSPELARDWQSLETPVVRLVGCG